MIAHLRDWATGPARPYCRRPGPPRWPQQVINYQQCPALPEPPTMNVDFYPEQGRTVVSTNWVAWWKGVSRS